MDVKAPSVVESETNPDTTNSDIVSTQENTEITTEEGVNDRNFCLLIVDNSRFSFTAYTWLVHHLLGQKDLDISILHVCKSDSPEDVTLGEYIVEGFVELCLDKKLSVRDRLVVPCAPQGVGATIANTCNEINPLFLVMGSRGIKNVIKRKLLKSVSTYCVWHCQVPVVIVPPPPILKKGGEKLRWETIYADSRAADSHVSIPKAVIAVDKTEISMRSLRWIVQSRILSDLVDIVLIHVIEGDEKKKGHNTVEELEGISLLKSSADICHENGYEHTTTELIYHKKSVALGIINYILSIENVDLVAVAPRPYVTRVKRTLVSGTSQTALAKSNCPVLIYNDSVDHEKNLSLYEEYDSDDQAEKKRLTDLTEKKLTSEGEGEDSVEEEDNAHHTSSTFDRFTDFFDNWKQRRRQSSLSKKNSFTGNKK